VATFVRDINRTKVVTLDILPTPSGGRADAARAAVAFEQRSWIPATELAAELGVSRRTLARWLRDIALGFPRPRVINNRLYFERGDIEAWKTATAVKVAGER
jgi:predicted DNA-binding transcriptional regulator AlpA